MGYGADHRDGLGSNCRWAPAASGRWDGFAFFGTVIASGAIAVANVLLPALIKRDFPKYSGAMMGVYTMAISGFAAVAAASTVPLGDLIGYGWRGALGVLAILAVVALLLWMPCANAHTPPPATAPTRSSLLRHALAWEVTVFFGLQSLLFYSVLSWLPSIYRDHGYSPAEAGLVLSAVTFVQIPVSLLVPRFAARARDQRRYIMISTPLTALGLAGVLIAPTTLPYLWAMIIGVGLGSSFAIGLLLFVLRGRTAADTAELSAMAQTFGYLLAATGPLLLGAVHDATGSWSPPLALLLVFVVPQFLAGVLAGRPLQIGRSD
jgi:MFS transporter, CP family, cyanate transporter